MVKKVISLVLAIGLFFNLSVNVFATGPELNISEFSVGDSISVVVEYSQNGKDIKTLFASGYKVTMVTDPSTGEYDLYKSEKNDLFKFDSSIEDRTNIAENYISYENDIYVGHYGTAAPTIPSVYANQYLVRRYISDYLESYYFEYTDDQYVLKYGDEIKGLFTTDSTKISHCLSYYNALISFDNNFREACNRGLSLIPGVSDMMPLIELYNSVDGVNDAEDFANAIVSYIVAYILQELSDILWVVDATIFLNYYGLALEAYRTVKGEFRTVQSYR